mgnify:CR=1 FL=1
MHRLYNYISMVYYQHKQTAFHFWHVFGSIYSVLHKNAYFVPKASKRFRSILFIQHFFMGGLNFSQFEYFIMALVSKIS